MRIGDLSQATRDGLRAWAGWQHGEAGLLDRIGDDPTEWAWIVFQLREAEDRLGWFPRGKWATIQVIEERLAEAARAERTMARSAEAQAK